MNRFLWPWRFYNLALKKQLKTACLLSGFNRKPRKKDKSL